MAVRAGLTQQGAVLDGPAVGVEALLQRAGEGGFWGQGVVDGDDGDAQLLGPGLEVGLMGLGSLGHKATTVDMHNQVLRAGCLLWAGPKLQGPRTLRFHQAAELFTVLEVREEEVGKAGAACLGLPPTKGLYSERQEGSRREQRELRQHGGEKEGHLGEGAPCSVPVPG